MKKRFSHIVFLVAFAGLLHFSVSAQTYKLIQPKYQTSDAFVAKYNVLDAGADPTGVKDNTLIFQQKLDLLGTRVANGGAGNGGVLFIPEGKYVIKGRLYIPKGVTIRGEWQKPVKGQPIVGTILMAYSGKGIDVGTTVAEFTTFENGAFITMQPGSAVRDLAIWYPEQDPSNITPYPPAILYGQPGYFGNEYCTTYNVTLVNAYNGVIFSRTNGGGCPNINGLYGTPLSRGIEIDNIADVGRVENVDFSPAYWAGSGLPNSPTLGGAYASWIYANGTALIMRRIDWSYACFVKAEGYNMGYHGGPSISESGPVPNGHNYGMEFTSCKYGIYAEAVDGVGQMHTKCKISNCEYGVYLASNPQGVLQLLGCDISATKVAVFAPATSTTKILMNQCTITKGAVDVRGGIVSMMNNDFNNTAPQISLGSDVRAIVTGNRFKEPVQITNYSKYLCKINHTPITMSGLPSFPYVNPMEIKQKQDRAVMYLATSYGVSTSSSDNTIILQTLLNQVKTDGGGIVYLPSGHYKFLGNLTIPSGVELKGSVDNPTVPNGPGSVLEIYSGKNETETGTPFISMEQNSGLRGVVFNYPEQVASLLPASILEYPYCVRGNANVYIVNVGFRATDRAIDLFTNKCDNHYVDYPAGHVFKTGIRVGGGSENGYISNTQFNPIVYAYGQQTKFGVWPNSPISTDTNYLVQRGDSYGYAYNNLEFLILGNCKNEVLYNNFTFGSRKGTILSSIDGTGPTGIALGHGIDGAVKSFNIEAIGAGSFDFINSQIVTICGSTNAGDIAANKPLTRFIETYESFTGKTTFFGADFWGQAYEIGNQIKGGNVELQTAHYQAPGKLVFSDIAPGSSLNMTNSNVNPFVTLLSSGSNPRFSIQSSVINSAGVDTTACGLWLNNLDQTASVSPIAGAFLPRTGWIASASLLTTDASKAIDGDISTRWSTLTTKQSSGQWFMVDMIQQTTLTGIYLDAGDMAYLPISYQVYTSVDGVNWTLVATGTAKGQIDFDKPQLARFVKVIQTGTSSSLSWRMAEFYVMYTGDYTALPVIKSDNKVAFFADNKLNLVGVSGISKISIYNISGQLVISQISSDSKLNVDLKSGVYVVVIENENQLYRQKILVR